MATNGDIKSTLGVIGATGYVAGRLIPRLLHRGYRVVAIGRHVKRLAARPWRDHPALDIRQADATKLDQLRQACQGCAGAFYLVHSMSAGNESFAEIDRRAAHNMVQSAREVSMERIIYLGGLGKQNDRLSPHLRSRAEVAAIFQDSSVPTTCLRAGMIIGAASGSFEIVRYLARRLPVMITPSWVRTLSEPIAIANVLDYLLGCWEKPETAGYTYDIGGPERLSYEAMFQVFCREAQLPRPLIIPVPILSPKLSSYWLSLVTPLPSWLTHPLALGMRNDVCCTEHRIRDIVTTHLLRPAQAVGQALQSWPDGKEIGLDDWVSHPARAMPGDPAWCGDRNYQRRLQTGQSR